MNMVKNCVRDTVSKIFCKKCVWCYLLFPAFIVKSKQHNYASDIFSADFFAQDINGATDIFLTGSNRHALHPLHQQFDQCQEVEQWVHKLVLSAILQMKKSSVTFC